MQGSPGCGEQEVQHFPRYCRRSLLGKRLKEGKRLRPYSWKLTVHSSVPAFQLKFNFPTAETTEVSGKCVVALATGKEVGGQLL